MVQTAGVQGVAHVVSLASPALERPHLLVAGARVSTPRFMQQAVFVLVKVRGDAGGAAPMLQGSPSRNAFTPADASSVEQHGNLPCGKSSHPEHASRILFRDDMGTEALDVMVDVDAYGVRQLSNFRDAVQAPIASIPYRAPSLASCALGKIITRHQIVQIDLRLGLLARPT